MKHTIRLSVVFHPNRKSPLLGAVVSLRRSRWFARHYIYYGESYDEQLFNKLVRQDAMMNSYEPNFIHFVLSYYS